MQVNPYLNFNSFAYPAAFTPGTLGRNTFEGPGMNWTQISLSKWWRVRERARFQGYFASMYALASSSLAMARSFSSKKT